MTVIKDGIQIRSGMQFPAEESQIDFQKIISSFNDYIDLFVLREVSMESEEDPSWVPEGWSLLHMALRLFFLRGSLALFNELDTQWRVNLTSGVWGTLDAASGWNYYAWPYSYSFDEGHGIGIMMTPNGWWTC